MDSWLDIDTSLNRFLLPINMRNNIEVDVISDSLDITYDNYFIYKKPQGNIRAPESYSLTISNMNKKQEYDLLSFFNSVKGNYNRFYFPVPINQFTLLENITTGQEQIKINYRIHSVFTGSFLYMLLKNGDYISRKIIDISCAEYNLEVQTAFDRDIAIDDILLFGRLILCRFTDAEIELTHLSSFVSETTLTVVELIKEY